MDKDPLKIALNFLKYRARSEQEIRRRLQKDKINNPEIERTITVLKNNRLLCDEEFAKMYVRDRNALKPSGSRLLAMELHRFGIASEVIADVLQDQEEEALAQKAISAKSVLKNASFEKKAQFLARRGFKSSIIYKLLRE